MPEHYSAKEALEHVEHAHELLERSEHAVLRFVPLLAAVLAIFAGLSSLYGGRLGEEALILKNEALLNEVQASDLWTEYQAESIKAHINETAAETADPKFVKHLHSVSAKYRSEQSPLRKQAEQHERARDAAMLASDAIVARKSNFDIALALFEIAIVLTSIAAMVKRQSLFVMAGIGGVIGIVFCLHGMLTGRQ
jgi:hypothetical protein